MSAPQAQVLNFLNFAAKAEGGSAPILKGIAQRESGFATGSDPNTTDSNAQAGHPSNYMFQFIPSTFAEYAAKAAAANPQAWAQTSGQFSDWKAQALAASYAISHGGAGNWTTYKAAAAAAGQPGAAGASNSRVGLVTPAESASAPQGLSLGVRLAFADDPSFLSDLSEHDATTGATTGETAGAAPVTATPLSSVNTSALPKGVETYDGKPVADWIVPALKLAAAKGWTGTVTSGYRTAAQQAALQGHSGGNPVAPVGESNHELDAFPGGAVDVTDAQQLSNILKGSQYAQLLQWAGAKDPVHFSDPHNGSY